MSAYYNENDAYAAKWITNLVEAQQIEGGYVDARSIRDVAAADLVGWDRAHFFAGIAGWAYAAELAGWPAGLQLWTGSCPCQPFSSAGRKRGFDDERHLWPVWFDLVRECRPAIVVGEQVASPDGLRWLDAVFADLEREDYACAAVDIPAGGVGAPHKRQRLYFVAVAGGERREGLGLHLLARRSGAPRAQAARRGAPRALADAERGGGRALGAGAAGGCAPLEPQRHGAARELGLAGGAGGGRHAGEVPAAEAGSDREGGEARGEPHVAIPAGATRGFWADCDWIYCRDGKYRAVEPGAFPLVDGVSGVVGQRRAYGNAIVAPLAAEFLGAVLDTLGVA